MANDLPIPAVSLTGVPVRVTPAGPVADTPTPFVVSNAPLDLDRWKLTPAVAPTDAKQGLAFADGTAFADNTTGVTPGMRAALAAANNRSFVASGDARVDSATVFMPRGLQPAGSFRLPTTIDMQLNDSTKIKLGGSFSHHGKVTIGFESHF